MIRTSASNAAESRRLFVATNGIGFAPGDRGAQIKPSDRDDDQHDEQRHELHAAYRIPEFIDALKEIIAALEKAGKDLKQRRGMPQMAGEPPDVAINPRLGHLGLLEFHRADEAIAEGRKAAERALPELRDAISLFAG